MWTSLLDLMLTYTPAGASMQTIIHFVQEVSARKFQHFDWGREGNLEHYGQEEPPEYDISEVNTPAFLYWSEDDCFADPEDVQWLSMQLSCPSGSFRVNVDDCGHLDFLWAVEVKELVNSWKKKRQQSIDERCLSRRPSLAYITSTENVNGEILKNGPRCQAIVESHRSISIHPSSAYGEIKRPKWVTIAAVAHNQKRIRIEAMPPVSPSYIVGSRAPPPDPNKIVTCLSFGVALLFDPKYILMSPPRAEWNECFRLDMEAGSSAVDGENPAWPTSKGHSVKKRFLPSLFKKKSASLERVGMGLISEQPLPFKKREKVHATPSPPSSDSADLTGSSRDARGPEGDRAESDASPPFPASFDHEAAARPEESVFPPSISLSDDKRVFSWKRHLALPMKPSVFSTASILLIESERSWLLPPELVVAAFFEDDCMMLNVQHRVGSGTEETKKICRRYHHPVLPIKVTVLESRGRTAIAMSVDYDAVDDLFPSLSRYLGSATTGKGRNELMEDEEGGCLIQELI
ncbi:unnamed protein product [Darwinula stevensoni]|uniref:Uncharacterized protein n=1 Tax=Darwinula stevensoni TaxID=69355 RepID=A0A7R9FRE1_9CRUS|nr:unnamed protein product [Darwinula stevensoni]CAG0900835.1 unnamed protein product [Darwinula stevensoni]